MLESIGLILSRCNALLFPVVVSARCARKSVPPGSTGRNASEYYAVGFDFAPRHYTGKVARGQQIGESRDPSYAIVLSVSSVLFRSALRFCPWSLRLIVSPGSLIVPISAICYLIDTAGRVAKA